MRYTGLLFTCILLVSGLCPCQSRATGSTSLLASSQASSGAFPSDSQSFIAMSSAPERDNIDAVLRENCTQLRGLVESLTALRDSCHNERDEHSMRETAAVSERPSNSDQVVVDQCQPGPSSRRSEPLTSRTIMSELRGMFRSGGASSSLNRRTSRSRVSSSSGFRTSRNRSR